MRWHLLTDTGRIARSITAPDKATAALALGPGTIVSELSYRAGQVYVPSTRPIIKSSRLPKLPPGYLYTRQAADQLNLSRQRFGQITKRLGLVPHIFRRIAGARQHFYWSPDHIAAVHHYHATQFAPERRAASQAKRRRSLLLHHAKRYAARIAARRLEWHSSRSPSPTCSAS